MPVMSSPSRQKSWQTHRERVSVMAALAIQKKTVVRRLNEIREAHRDPSTGKPLSQERAAARVGVTMRQWQRWESGASLPYPRNLEAIAETFGFPVSDFFDEQGEVDAATSRTGVDKRLGRIETRLQELEIAVAHQNSNLQRQSLILERIEDLVGILRDAEIVTEQAANGGARPIGPELPPFPGEERQRKRRGA